MVRLFLWWLVAFWGSDQIKPKTLAIIAYRLEIIALDQNNNQPCPDYSSLFLLF